MIATTITSSINEKPRRDTAAYPPPNAA
jgi:hypothetical protein